jgi:hypothetical protein
VVDDAHVSHWAGVWGKRGVRLSHVDLGGCALMTDAAVSAISRHLGASLRSLTLANCPRITDVALLALAKHAQGLEELDIQGCVEVSSQVRVDMHA